MQFQTLFISALMALASAQNTPSRTLSLPTNALTVGASTTSPTPTSTGSLVALVQGLPSCGVKCLSDAAKSANCNAADLQCLCSNSGQLTSNVSLILCVSNNCNGDETAKLVSDAPQICDKLNNNNASPAEISSASSIVASALGTAGVSTSSSTGLAPRRTDAPALAVMGGAAAAAFAAYAI